MDKEPKSKVPHKIKFMKGPHEITNKYFHYLVVSFL